MSLPLLLGVVATGISQYNNEGALWALGVVGHGGRTKNASCSEPDYEIVRFSELRGLQLPGVDEAICTGGSPACEWWAITSGRASHRLNHFRATPGQYSTRFAHLAMGCPNPAFASPLWQNSDPSYGIFHWVPDCGESTDILLAYSHWWGSTHHVWERSGDWQDLYE